MEARSLKFALRNETQSDRSPSKDKREEDARICLHPLPQWLHASRSATAYKRCATITPFPLVPLGGMPGNGHAVVDREKPLRNFSREKRTKLRPISLKNFKVVPEAG